MTSMHTPEVVSKFFKSVEKTDGCWMWRAGKFPGGYGAIHTNGKTRKAHRVSWEIHFGPIGEGLFVCHRCDTPRCVNPEHLFLGTAADNNADRNSKGRQARGEKITAKMRIYRGDEHWSRKYPERLARGEKNGSRSKPESRPRGDAHYSRISPEKLARGDRNGSRARPESRPRGEQHTSAKLTASQVREIKARYSAGTETQSAIAKQFGVSRSLVSEIVRGNVWKGETA